MELGPPIRVRRPEADLVNTSTIGSIADDQPLIRPCGFRQMIQGRADLALIGEVDDGRQAVQAAQDLAPDVILMDIRMPVLDGLEATRQIRAASSRQRPKVLVLTTFDLDEYVYAALKAGASGFLVKDVTPEALSNGIRTVHTGATLLAASVTVRLVERYVDDCGAGTDTAALRRLTEREQEVLRQVALGRSNAEIARHLYVAEATVKSHVAHMFTKLDVNDRVQAVVYAYETGFVRPCINPC